MMVSLATPPKPRPDIIPPWAEVAVRRIIDGLATQPEVMDAWRDFTDSARDLWDAASPYVLPELISAMNPLRRRRE